MKKLGMILGVGLLVLASGCGSSYEEYDKSVLQFSKKESITEVIYDTFEEPYYIEEELESSINGELEAYNADKEEDLVELKTCKVDEQDVFVELEYQSSADYAAFNHVGLFHGTMAEFVASEYHAYADLKDKDGEQIPLSSIVASGENYSVVAMDMDCIVEVKGKIYYVSEGVEILSDKAADVTVNDMAYAYIIYK